MATDKIKSDSIYTTTPVDATRLFRHNKLRIFRFEGAEVGSNGVITILSAEHYAPINIDNSCIVIVSGKLYPGYVRVTTGGVVDVHYFTSMGGSNAVAPSGAAVYGEIVWLVN